MNHSLRSRAMPFLLGLCLSARVNLAPAASSASKEAVAPVVVFDALRKALEDNYPMLEYAGWDDAWVKEFREKVVAAPTPDEAFQLMDEVVCRLNDYHTRFTWPARPPLGTAPLRVEPVFTSANGPTGHPVWEMRPPWELPPLDGIALAVLEAEGNPGIQAGDEIIAVEGVPVREALARTWVHSPCSSAMGKLRGATGRLLAGPRGSELHLTLRRRTQGGEETVAASVALSGLPGAKLISSREVEGIPLICISRWTNPKGGKLSEEFDKLLEQYREKPALVIDVRGNGGGEDQLASAVVGRFLKKPVIASISFHRLVPGTTFERTVDLAQPRGPWRYEGRVAVLTDEGCMSATEHFVSGMAEAGALLCGTPTSGACGWIRPLDLPGGAHLNVSQTFPLHSGGIPSPQLGIAPHLWAPRTLEDARAGTDTALRAALKWVKSQDPLPARLQPLAPFAR